MAYEMVMPYHLHMPSYFLETFTEYPYLNINLSTKSEIHEESSLFYRMPLFCNKHDGANKNDNRGSGRCHR